MITQIRDKLGFSSKKAVIMAGLKSLLMEYEKQKRVKMLQKASLLVRKESQKINSEMVVGSLFRAGRK